MVKPSIIELARKYHRDLDAVIGGAAEGLAREGRPVVCAMGCASCCRLPVLATLPEAALVARHVADNLPRDAAAVTARLEAWLAWTESELPALSARGVPTREAYLERGPGCPFLEEEACMIYPARPMGCRVHSSTAPAVSCGPGHGSSGLFAEPGTVPEILDAARPVCMEYRRRVEEMGMPFGSAVRPLPALVLGELRRAGDAFDAGRPA